MELLTKLLLIIPPPQYCERISHPAGSEPVNLITNLAFIIAAIVLFKQIETKSFSTKALIFFLFLSGVGSGLWHTFGTTLTLAADFIPIYLFAGLAFWRIHHLLTKSVFISTILLFIYLGIVISLTTLTPPEFLNGSIRHFASLGFIIFITAWIIKSHPQIKLALLIPPVYAIAILFRTIDISVCQSFPIGTHFLWHILAAATLYLMTITIHKLETKQVN